MATTPTSINPFTLSIHEHDNNTKYYYEVCFKCSSDIFLSNEQREYGEMVIIHSDRGYNIGFVLREVMDYEISPSDLITSNDTKQTGSESPNHPPLPLKPPSTGRNKVKLLTTITDSGSKIQSVLESKIDAENYAAYQCIIHMRGHRLSQVTEILSTEFQFDRKKLTIYLKKNEEVSVCRLVRKLHERFKMRIKIVEVHDVAAFQQILLRYLELSQLNITPETLFTPSPDLTESGSLFLQSKSTPSTQKDTPTATMTKPIEPKFRQHPPVAQMPVRLPTQMSQPVYPHQYLDPYYLQHFGHHHPPPLPPPSRPQNLQQVYQGYPYLQYPEPLINSQYQTHRGVSNFNSQHYHHPSSHSGTLRQHPHHLNVYYPNAFGERTREHQQHQFR